MFACLDFSILHFVESLQALLVVHCVDFSGEKKIISDKKLYIFLSRRIPDISFDRFAAIFLRHNFPRPPHVRENFTDFKSHSRVAQRSVRYDFRISRSTYANRGPFIFMQTRSSSLVEAKTRALTFSGAQPVHVTFFLLIDLDRARFSSRFAGIFIG